MQRYKNIYKIYNRVSDIIFKINRFTMWANSSNSQLWALNLYSVEKDIRVFKRDIWKPFLQKLQAIYPIRCFGVTEYQSCGNIHVHLLLVFQNLYSESRILRDINKFIRSTWIETNCLTNGSKVSRRRMKLEKPLDKNAWRFMLYMSKLFKGGMATKMSSFTSKNNRMESWSVSGGLDVLNLWSYCELPSRSLSPKKRKEFVASFLNPYQIENPGIKSKLECKLNE